MYEGLNGEITSPDYPAGYAENLDCTYHIIPDINYLPIRMTDIDMLWEPQCRNGSVVINDGSYNHSKVMERFCDSLTSPVHPYFSPLRPSQHRGADPTMWSSEVNITIRFRTTKAEPERRGFKIVYGLDYLGKDKNAPCGGVFAGDRGEMHMVTILFANIEFRNNSLLPQIFRL